MTRMISHHAGAKPGPSELEDRFCRPGAAYGARNLEFGMGVRHVYHELASLRGGTIRCPTCKLSFEAGSES